MSFDAAVLNAAQAIAQFLSDWAHFGLDVDDMKLPIMEDAFYVYDAGIRVQAPASVSSSVLLIYNYHSLVFMPK